MSNTIEVISALLWVVVGVCLAAGLHHIFVAVRRERGSTNFAFALVCFSVALYAACNIGLYRAETPEIYRFYLKLQIGLAFLSGLSFLWFVAFYTRVLPWPVLGFMTLYALGLIAFHASLPYGIYFQEFSGVGTTHFAWGGSIHFPLVKYAAARTRWGDFNAVMHIAFFLFAIVTQYRRGERKAALLLGLCVALYFGSAIHDISLARAILIDRPDVISRIPIQEYGFVSLVVLMSLRLSNEVLDAAAVREALVQSEQNLRITLDSIGDGVISTDERGCVSRMNPVAATLTGWSAEEAAGRPLPEIFQIINARTRVPVANPAEKVLRTGRIVGLANHTLLIHRDGSERQIADSGAPIRAADGRVLGVVLVFRDVTRQYTLEDQLRHSQKMEAMGRMAGGVAHDFNNLLQAIHGYTSIALKEVGHNGRTRNDLLEVLRTADRAGLLVRQLLTFSRRESFQPRALDLNSLVTDLINLLRKVIGLNIEMALHFDSALPAIHGDRGQIEQILMNLCVNARDATRDRGEIRISTATADLDEAFCLQHPWARPGRYAVLSVSDDGVGMGPDLQERIFEPYFTTKSRGEGTGLGLATVFAIVERHEGLIHVASATGEGSTFSVYFPATETGKETGGSRDGTESQPAGSGTVLLAEDEEVVRNLAVYTLEGAGYRVLAASDGEAAWRIFEERAGDIDVAVLDLIMPNLGGRPLFERIRQARPELPVVFSSGYSPDGLDRLIAEDTRTRLLQKPHPSGDLLRAVKSVLEPDRQA